MGKSIFDQIDTSEEWKRTKKAIKISGFSVNAVCKAAKVSPSTTFAWDKGTAHPSAEKVNQIKSGLAKLLEERKKKWDEIK